MMFCSTVNSFENQAPILFIQLAVKRRAFSHSLTELLFFLKWQAAAHFKWDTGNNVSFPLNTIIIMLLF